MLEQFKEKFATLNQRTKYVVYTVAGIVFVGVMGLALYHAKAKNQKPITPKDDKPQIIKLDGVTTDFSSSNELSALKENQLQVDDLAKEVGSLKSIIKDQQQAQKDQKASYEKKIAELHKNINDVRKEASKKPLPQIDQPKRQLSLNIVGRGGNTKAYENNQYSLGDATSPKGFGGDGAQISSFSFDFEASHKKINLFDNLHYAPTGTFVKAVMLNGADAAAGMTTQGNAQPVVFKLLENGYAPNGKRIPLKGCFVTAGITGDISSERGIIKLDRISCTKKDGSVLDIPVEGTAIDNGGKNGIRGIPVMRNGKVMMLSGLSGMLSGIGSTVAQASQTTSVSPLGATISTTGTDAIKSGFGQGMDNAFSKISQYYIDLANQYHPIVQVNAGSVVDLVFLGGFSLDANQSKPIGYHKPMQYNDHTEPKSASEQASEQVKMAQKAFSNFKLGKE